MNMTFANNASQNAMSLEQKTAMLSAVAAVLSWDWAISAAFAALLVAVQVAIVCLAVLVAHGRGRPAQHFSLVTNTSLIGVGLAALLQGTLIHLRGVDAYQSANDLIMTLPSAAWLLPNSTAAVLAALSTLNPLSVWAASLLTYGLKQATCLPVGGAILIAMLPTATSAALSALYAR